MSQLEKTLGQALSPRPRRRKVDYCKARRLASKLGVEITIETDAMGNGYWIEDERLDGDRFCTSWAEVAEKLQALEAQQ